MAKNNFWQTVPGILTAIAAVITAVGGLITILIQVGAFGTEKTAAPLPTTTPIPGVAVLSSSSPTAATVAGKAWTDAVAVITAKDGTQTRAPARTVRFCISAGTGINLNDSLDIPFEKMSSIEVLNSDVALSSGGRATLRVHLTSGATKDGTITSGCDFIAQAEEGRYSLYPDRLTKIEFLR